MARARSRASPARTAASGPPGHPRPGSRRRGSGGRRRPGSRWPRRGRRGRSGRPRRVRASSIEGRSSRIRLAVCTISMAPRRGQHAPRIRAQDLRHHEGEDGTQALGGREEAVLERRLHRGRAPGSGQPPQRLLDLQAAVLERRLERGERAASAHARDVTPEALESPSSEEPIHSATSGWGGRRSRRGGHPTSDAAPPEIDYGLPRGRRRHLRRRRGQGPHQAPGPRHVQRRRALGDRLLRRDVPARLRRAIEEPVLVASTDGVGTKIQVAILAGRPRHRGLRPRGPLRERHPGAGRRARSSSSTTSPSGRWTSSKVEAIVRGLRARLRRVRLPADRRRDRGDARHLRARRLRPRGLHRGGGRQRARR